MASIEDIRKERIQKLELLKKAGMECYPSLVKRTHTTKEALDAFSDLVAQEKEITVVGRIRSFREHGGSAFFHIEDGSGKLQAYLRKNRVGEESFSLFLEAMDVGDFVQLRGILFNTQKGEKTIEVSNYSILAKSLLPLPDKWHGLQDVEERYRKRYLDLLFNEEAKQKFRVKSIAMRAVREFLDQEGFFEVETPVLQNIYGGADAEPFTTRINAFDMDMYLRISLELPLKRLMVGGFEKVYEMGRVFRNEGVDRQHSPDFTMLEFYWAYADYKDMMKLTERLISRVVEQTHGSYKVFYGGKEIDFTPPWPRVEYSELFRKYANITIEEMDKDALLAKAKTVGAEADETFSKGKLVDAIYKKVIRPYLWEPQFVIHHPSEMFPLAKARQENPAQAETVQLLVGGGWELVKAYSEQNDPLAQRKAFEEQESLFRKGLGDAQRMDEDFLEALEYGMPPTAGFGMGIDRLTTLLTDSHSLREVTLFPTMKPKS
ncbi:MAG: lysine--tRNA ligase [bacterium]|nr:lysine--tRNA ligase [bacterium]